MSEAQLRPGKEPPPPAPTDRARSAGKRRARAAVRILEKHGWVTDREGYPSRPSAIGYARRLIDGLVAHEGVPRRELRRRVWLERDGWHWQVGLKRER